MTHQTECPSCGGPAALLDLHSQAVQCAYCGKSFEIPKALQPNPATDRPWLRADLTDPNLPGWEKVNPDHQTITPGPPPELHAFFQPSERVHFILKTSGYFDDQDISVAIRFLEGNCSYIRAGLCLRYQDQIGGYCVLISARSTYLLGYYETPEGKEMSWKAIMDWRTHNALKPGLNAVNKLRIVAKGNQLSIFLNGHLATSIRDDTYRRGQSHIAAEPSNKSNIRVAFSDLVIHEPQG